MILKLQVGHYYRLKKQFITPGEENTIMVVHDVKKSGLGMLAINMQYFNSEEVLKERYTDPDIWEEV